MINIVLKIHGHSALALFLIDKTAEFLRHCCWANSLSPTFRGGIIFPFRLISSISYAGLTAKTLYRKKTISENDIEPLIFIFSLWWQMCENNQTDQNWIISKRTVTILLSNLNSAQNNMTFILWGALGRHYSKMVLQTEVYQLPYRKTWMQLPSWSNVSSWGHRAVNSPGWLSGRLQILDRISRTQD